MNQYIETARNILDKRKELSHVSEKNKQIICEFISKAATDSKFLDQLRRDPKKVIEDFGIKVPDDVVINVVTEGETVAENNDQEINITIPREMNTVLSDEDLEKVAGGGGVNVPKTIDSFFNGMTKFYEKIFPPVSQPNKSNSGEEEELLQG